MGHTLSRANRSSLPNSSQFDQWRTKVAFTISTRGELECVPDTPTGQSDCTSKVSSFSSSQGSQESIPRSQRAAGSSINDHLVGAFGHLSVYIGPRGALISILLYWVNSSKSPRPTAVEIACMSRDNGLSVVRRGTKLRINSRARSMGLEERSGRR